ncbi:MAG: hypothetical protein E7260_03175 [Lachnospiraceae bacterium]|nr:hypothetical protein [Lachnospiraceae bacterium]
MKGKKSFVTYGVLVLMMLLFLSVVACQIKAPTEEETGNSPVIEEEILDSQTFEMGENAYMKIEETASYRIAEYYADEKLTQRAVYEFATGEILAWIWESGSDKAVIERYHIDDFKVDGESE